jgi:hypothetical protein
MITHVETKMTELMKADGQWWLPGLESWERLRDIGQRVYTFGYGR